MTKILKKEIFHTQSEAQSAASRINREFPDIYRATVQRLMTIGGTHEWFLVIAAGPGRVMRAR